LAIHVELVFDASPGHRIDTFTLCEKSFAPQIMDQFAGQDATGRRDQRARAPAQARQVRHVAHPQLLVRDRQTHPQLVLRELGRRRKGMT